MCSYFIDKRNPLLNRNEQRENNKLFPFSNKSMSFSAYMSYNRRNDCVAYVHTTSCLFHFKWAEELYDNHLHTRIYQNSMKIGIWMCGRHRKEQNDRGNKIKNRHHVPNSGKRSKFEIFCRWRCLCVSLYPILPLAVFVERLLLKDARVKRIL